MSWLDDTPDTTRGGKEHNAVDAIRGEIESRGGIALKTTGVAVAGTPDLIGSYRGRALAWEIKSRTGRPSRLQQHRLTEWAAAGAHTAIVRTRSQARQHLNTIDKEIACT